MPYSQGISHPGNTITHGLPVTDSHPIHTLVQINGTLVADGDTLSATGHSQPAIRAPHDAVHTSAPRQTHELPYASLNLHTEPVSHVTERVPLPSHTAASLLIASSDEWSARAMECILSAEGFNVRQVNSGHDAVELALSGTFDAIVTDETLEDSSSLDLCRLLRDNREVGSTLPVILMLHGPVDRETRLTAHEAGVWQVFGEPLDATLLVRQLQVFTAHSHRKAQQHEIPAV